MGMVFENLTEEELCDLMCGGPEEDFEEDFGDEIDGEELDFTPIRYAEDGYFMVKWNKCSEKLPIKSGFYLTSSQNGKVTIMEYCRITDSKSYWLSNDIVYNPVAWMNLPPAYEE